MEQEMVPQPETQSSPLKAAHLIGGIPVITTALQIAMQNQQQNRQSYIVDDTLGLKLHTKFLPKTLLLPNHGVMEGISSEPVSCVEVATHEPIQISHMQSTFPHLSEAEIKNRMERKLRVVKYLQKKARRLSFVRYEKRKSVAERRIRYKGRVLNKKVSVARRLNRMLVPVG
jgi:hypothetical protein